MSRVVPPEKVLRRDHRWLRLSLWLLALLVVLLCALPIGLRLGAEYWLNEQPDMSAQLGDVDLNLFSGTLQLEDLEIYHLQQRVMAAQKMKVEINWWPLLRRRLYVEQITVDEGILYLSQQQDAPLAIAGFFLANDSTQEPAVLSDTSAVETSPEWGLHSGHISAKNFQLIYQTPTIELDVVVNQLSVEPVVSWRSELASPIDADIVVNGGVLKLEGAISPFAPNTLVDTSIGLTGFKLESIAKTLDHSGLSEASGTVDCALQLIVANADDEARSVALAISGEVQATDLRGGTPQAFFYRLNSRWAGDVTLTLGTASELIFDGDLSLSDVDLDLLESGLKIEQPHLAWHGKGALVGEELTLSADLSLTESSVTDLAKQRQLFSLRKLDFSALTIDGLEHINIGIIVAQGVQVLQRGAEADSSHSVAIERTTLSSVALTEMAQLHVAAFHLAGLKVGLKRTVSGALDLQEWFTPAEDDNTREQRIEPPGEIHAETEAPFTVRIDEIKVDQKSQVRLVDSTMNPPIPVTLGKIVLQIADLDSSKPQQPSPLTFTSMVGRYSNLDLNGHIKPFMQPIGLQLVGSLREFNVTTVSPYSEKSIGYQLQQGQLNVDFTLPVADGMMALESDIYLKQFRLQALSVEDEANASERIGLPVNLALSLLRDRDGDIHLELPVKGDLNDPNLHIGPIIRSALLHTLHNTVMLPLAPLGIVSKAGEMIGLGNALSFERVVFESGTAVMAQPSQEYLGNVAKLLSERSQLTVAVCGRFTEQDHEVFMLEEKDEDVLRKKRRELAEERAVAVKEQLLQGGQVKAAQLLLCRPTSTVISGVPGVDLTLQ